MEEVVKEKEERLAQYERIGIRKEGEESEKERKEKHEENEEIVKELKNRMEEWREKYMEKERKLREIEKEIEEFGMSCVECENKEVRVQRMSSDNYELRELHLGPYAIENASKHVLLRIQKSKKVVNPSTTIKCDTPKDASRDRAHAGETSGKIGVQCEKLLP
ncbi:hypothetical protein ACJJTC_013597 [Scirpophaga incertulas]